jgi:hypothetical protein
MDQRFHQTHCYKIWSLCMEEDKEIRWRQYQQHIDTYKFYLDLVVKLMGFYFAISGAIVSYYSTHAASEHAELSLYLL